MIYHRFKMFDIQISIDFSLEQSTKYIETIKTVNIIVYFLQYN